MVKFKEGIPTKTIGQDDIRRVYKRGSQASRLSGLEDMEVSEYKEYTGGGKPTGTHESRRSKVSGWFILE